MHLLPLLFLCAFADAKPLSFTLTISAGKHDRVNEPVCVSLLLPEDNTAGGWVYDDKGNSVGPAGRARPSLLTALLDTAKGTQQTDVWFVLPKLEAGKTATYELRLEGEKRWDEKALLEWRKAEGRIDLVRGKKPVFQYVHPKLNPANREATFKVFHHVYDADGKLLTKGVGGQFTHHRGLFYGFMKTSYGKNMVDIWHCKGDTHQAHREVDEESKINPVLGQHRVVIDWNGVGGKTFATELRQLTAIPLPGGTLFEFASKLTPTGDDVKVDGDPQHAGFHFRASNGVAELQAAYDKASKIKDPEKREEALKKVAVKDLTYFVRPDGTGKPGTEVNWPGNKKHVNLPWLGMSFVVGGQRYTAGYIDHPSNPKEARFSERAYGRFGSYFVTTATKDKPLLVRYRVWVQKGEMKAEELAALSKSFVEPVAVKVTPK